ncbi:MAG TPA: DEAD/DEAH box helicase family protein, partial [Ktedonobacteraceae bacterium]|nr:DEAD/DEAH box helicase family protein [Ktedonobacteraceae bacterium]
MSREKEIRQELIDGILREAGWSVENGNLITEFYFPRSSDLQIKEQQNAYPPSKAKRRFADYVMLDKDRQPIAVLEAKSDENDKSPLDGLEQVEEYADRIKDLTGKQPFIFLSNGNETYYWDREQYPPRRVSGIYQLEDMERILQLRLLAQPLHLIQINQAIVDRDYQQRAIRTIVDGIKQRKHKFLLVMATGTGKTRTVIALVDLLIRARRIRRVLFLADRRELVRQASMAFKE